jgi:hypothetical protein
MYALCARGYALLQDHEAAGDDDTARGRDTRPRGERPPAPVTWTWVVTQVVDVLRQFPGGLAVRTPGGRAGCVPMAGSETAARQLPLEGLSDQASLHSLQAAASWSLAACGRAHRSPRCSPSCFKGGFDGRCWPWARGGPCCPGAACHDVVLQGKRDFSAACLEAPGDASQSAGDPTAAPADLPGQVATVSELFYKGARPHSHRRRPLTPVPACT